MSSIVVGYGPESRGAANLEFGWMLARAGGLDLVVVCVVPDRWQPVSVARSSDTEYQAHLEALASGALAAARERLERLGAQAQYDIVTARSGPVGLGQAAERHDARILVAGSSAAGAWGHIALGSVTDRLLHSADRPVGIAPRGYRPGARQDVERLTVAHDGTPDCDGVLQRAAETASMLKVGLRVVTFAVRPGQMIPSEVGLKAEDEVVAVWRRDAGRRVQDAVAQLGLTDVEHVVAEGADWADALDAPDWLPGDVLVVGSSASQSFLARVFLGSTAARIVRHSPVPVVVVP